MGHAGGQGWGSASSLYMHATCRQRCVARGPLVQAPMHAPPFPACMHGGYWLLGRAGVRYCPALQPRPGCAWRVLATRAGGQHSSSLQPRLYMVGAGYWLLCGTGQHAHNITASHCSRRRVRLHRYNRSRTDPIWTAGNRHGFATLSKLM